MSSLTNAEATELRTGSLVENGSAVSDVAERVIPDETRWSLATGGSGGCCGGSWFGAWAQSAEMRADSTLVDGETMRQFTEHIVFFVTTWQPEKQKVSSSQHSEKNYVSREEFMIKTSKVIDA